jgi:hypothetical protein
MREVTTNTKTTYESEDEEECDNELINDEDEEYQVPLN